MWGASAYRESGKDVLYQGSRSSRECFSKMEEELVGEDLGGKQLGPGADTGATSETSTGMGTLSVW